AGQRARSQPGARGGPATWRKRDAWRQSPRAQGADRISGMVRSGLAVSAVLVARGLAVDPPDLYPAVVDAPGGLDHHVAQALRIAPGAAQDRFHDLVIEQFFEARLVAAAFCASGHGPLRTRGILRSIAAKRVRIVTTTRRFRGNSPIASAQFALKWNRSPSSLFAPRC